MITKIHSVSVERCAKGRAYLSARILTETDDAIMISRDYSVAEAEDLVLEMNTTVDADGLCCATINEAEWVCVSSRSRSLEIDVAQGAWRDGI